MKIYILVDTEQKIIKKEYFKNKNCAICRMSFLNEKYKAHYKIMTLEQDDFDEINPDIDFYDWGIVNE